MTLRSIPAGLVGVCLFLGAGARADSPRGLVARGNAAYAAGKFAEALEAYEKASVELPEAPQLYFNKASALYKQGDYAKATEAFEQAALKTKDLALEARCNYNLGNCAFQEGERQKDSDLQKALDAYGKSVRHYQEALKLDPALADAAHNIEVVRLLMKDLLDKLKKQQEEMKKNEEQQKELIEKLKALIERQQKAIEANRSLAEQKPPPGDFQDRAGKLADEQKDIKGQTGELAEKMPAPPPQPGQPLPPAAQAKEHLQSAATEQAIAEQRLRKEKLDEARPAQEKALDELKKALASLAGPQPPQPGQAPEEQPQPQAEKQQAEARDEKAHDILEEEKKNRDQRRIQAPAGYQPVDKDW